MPRIIDPKDLLRVYHDALASGRFTLEQINSEIEVTTGGQYKTYAALARAAFNVQQGQNEAAAARRVAEREPGSIELVASGVVDRLAGGIGIPEPNRARAIGDFARAGAHGATFGFSDEIAGAIPGGLDEAQVRQRIEDLRSTDPTATALAEIAGGAAAPVGVGGAAFRSGSGLASRAARGGLAGGAAGAATGALTGFGEGEGLEDRARAAVGGAVTGGVVGTALGTVAPVLGRFVTRLRKATRGKRVARDLRRTTGITETLEEAFARADDHIASISDELYGPLDDAFNAVEDPGVLEALSDPEIRSVVRSVSKEVATGKRPPSFEELQTIRNKARSRRGTSPATADAGDVLSQEMQRAIPGLQQADRAYARAVELAEGLEAGFKWGSLTARSKDSDLARRAMSEFGPEGQEAFREGFVQSLIKQLESREGIEPSTVRAMLQAGPEIRARIRAGFPNEESFNEFMTLVATEQSARAFSEKASKFIRWLIIGGIAGGTAAAIGGRGGGEE